MSFDFDFSLYWKKDGKTITKTGSKRTYRSQNIEPTEGNWIFNGNGNGGPVNSRTGPTGQPSDSFNTYDPQRDGGVMPFMADLGGNRSGNFSYLNVDSAPPFDYAHISQDNNSNNQPLNSNTTMSHQRTKKLDESKYEALLAQRQADPYIQQSMPSSY